MTPPPEQTQPEQTQPELTPQAANPGSYLLAGTVLTDGLSMDNAVVAVAGGRIVYAGPRAGLDAEFSDLEELELPPGSMILPGLIDLHCHGAAGGDFPTGDGKAARTAVGFLHRSGTTTLLASLVTASREDLLSGLGTLRQLADAGLIAGIHSEGPFLSHARCGAQDPRFLLEPDLQLLGELIDAAGGHLRTMTYAPELPGADAVVRLLAERGVTPSLGHTDADARTTAASLTEAAELLAASGLDTVSCPTVTHLFNGMPPLHHRSPGPVAACLRLAGAGTVAVELIADGVHLDHETVRMVFDLVGPENVVLVTDSMAATGLPDGDYELGPQSVSVSRAVARLGDGTLAGGTATLLGVVRRTIAAGVEPAAAVRSATAVPAAIIGRRDIGSLRAGLRADVVVVDGSFERVLVMRGGQLLD